MAVLHSLGSNCRCGPKLDPIFSRFAGGSGVPNKRDLEYTYTRWRPRTQHSAISNTVGQGTKAKTGMRSNMQAGDGTIQNQGRRVYAKEHTYRWAKHAAMFTRRNQMQGNIVDVE